MHGKHIGEFALGDELSFAFSMRNEQGEVIATWTPAYYDIIDNADGSAVTSDLGLVAVSGYGDDLYRSDESSSAGGLLTLSTGNGLAEGGTYTVVVKDDQTGEPSNYVTLSFSVGHQASIEADTALILDTETADGTAEAAPNSLLGRARTLEQNQTDVIFPRLKRALGLLGEHQLVDGYLHDDSGNVTECRLRTFNTKANRDSASIWEDRQNDSDPAPSLETGELARYTVSSSHLLPRNLRTVYQGAINTDQDDNAYTGSVS